MTERTRDGKTDLLSPNDKIWSLKNTVLTVARFTGLHNKACPRLPEWLVEKILPSFQIAHHCIYFQSAILGTWDSPRRAPLYHVVQRRTKAVRFHSCSDFTFQIFLADSRIGISRLQVVTGNYHLQFSISATRIPVLNSKDGQLKTHEDILR